MPRRQEIRLTPAEQEAFLARSRTLVLCTIDRHGYPHAVAMWYVTLDGNIHMTTYRKSQKVLNLRRDPRCTVLVESGELYHELRGLMIRGHAEIVDDLDLCTRILTRAQEKHGLPPTDDMIDVLRAHAAKRVVLRIIPERVASWDHGKLAGGY